MNQWTFGSAETTFTDIQHLDVSDKIQLSEKIGLGGHSDVWLGTLDTVDGQLQVAIKELRVRHHQSNMPQEERLRRRFFREVALWARLHHPNIVPLLGFSAPAGGLPMLVSPWYQNGNIVDYLQMHPDAKRPKLLLDIAYGISYLHSLPLVHGDIKGDNILVDVNGSASLCDFGMSKFIDEALHITGFTTTGQTGGTPRCMAPELLEDEPKTTMTDVWAFGCTTIQIMTDLVPYPHKSTVMAVQMAIIRGESPLPPQYEASTSQEVLLWEEVRKCWMLPSQRPSINLLLAHINSIFFPSINVGPRASNTSNNLSDGSKACFFTQDIPGSYHTKVVSTFPQIHADSEATLTEEEQSARLYTPIAVIQIAFPGMPSYLHFFKPCYCLMLHRCLQTPRPSFGMVMPPPGPVGSELNDYGTMVEIVGVQMLPNGRSMVEIRGTHRFRILERDTLDGYPIGRTQRIDDHPADVEAMLERIATVSGSPIQSSTTTSISPQLLLEPSNAELKQICLDFYEQLKSDTAPWVFQQLINTYGMMPEDLSTFTFWMATILPMDEQEKAKLLPIRSSRLRLWFLVHHIETLCNSWWFTSGCIIS